MGKGKPEKIELRMTFEGDDAARFLRVKESRGVQAYNELVRVLVSEADRDLAKKSVEVVAQ